MNIDRPGVSEPRLAAALDELRNLSTPPPRPPAVAAARAALHRALEDRSGPAGGRLRPRLGGLGLALAMVSIMVGAGGTLAFAAHARPSSPLHGIRLAEERVIYDLAGKNRPSVGAGFAQSRLADARANVDRKDSLAEAETWLKEASTTPSADRAGDAGQKLEEVTREVNQEQQNEVQSGESSPTSPAARPGPTTTPGAEGRPGSGEPSRPSPTEGPDRTSPNNGPNNGSDRSPSSKP
jgi:hypothetical protein